MKRLVASVGLALALVMAGCAQRPTAMEPPSDTVNALVEGPVESAFLEPLRSTVKLVQYDGSQKSGDYDLVILDGDHHTPAALREDALVKEALGAGKWVLGTGWLHTSQIPDRPLFDYPTLFCGATRWSRDSV
ncbi:hypothetical protein FNU79_10100 [Deinococcus detaillensis]|uniref:Uncharacterized protein n=1 Tax=Deinococcus detaillensis TaxID=2592048 RepID=A0A553UZ87_9DEIO|nr:hypothetical protein [Deinococcus detaillensis]TSA85533.1 hypothetical protein FNU79_10100 [Deinococcus detaillensis]